jgi:DNA-binding NarL/FixJ family response regulator
MINPNLITKVIKLFSEMAQSNFAVRVEKNGKKNLTRTEKKVIYLVGRGLSNKEIAEKINLSEGTVRNNLSSVLSKLNLRDRTQLAIWAIQTGMMQPIDYEA